jgi:hypothetical protein
MCLHIHIISVVMAQIRNGTLSTMSKLYNPPVLSNMALRTIPGMVDQLHLDTDTQVIYLDTPAIPPERVELISPRSGLVGLLLARGVTSVAMVARKAKRFDDGLYAAIELVLHARKMQLLWDMHDRFVTGDSIAARAYVRAAIILGGGPAPSTDPPSVQMTASYMVRKLLADRRISEPRTFYTWSVALGRAWRMGRFLQGLIVDPNVVLALRSLICRNSHMRESYAAIINLSAALTGKSHLPTVFDQDRSIQSYFFPPPPSPLEALTARDGPPLSDEDDTRLDQVSVHDDLLGRIAGDDYISLDPRPTSGWHDLRIWALEPLLRPERMPEASRLLTSTDYTDSLFSVARSVLVGSGTGELRPVRSSTRSPRPAQPSVATPSPVDCVSELFMVGPDIVVEPQPSYYLRMAASYEYLYRVLTSHLTPVELDEARVLGEGGVCTETTPPIAIEVRRMGHLFTGLAMASKRELGEDPGRTANEALARAWLGAIAADEDVIADDRTMVVLYHDAKKGLYRVACNVGLCKRTLISSFVSPPRPVNASANVEFVDTRQTCLWPVTIECFSRQPMDDAEFRMFCDGHKTLDSLITALGKRQPTTLH